MNYFSGMGTTGGHARGAHLALVEGGSRSDAAAATSAINGSSSARGASGPATTDRVNTAYAAAAGQTGEAARTRHEQGVRAVARAYDNLNEALIPMVLASGVSGEQAPRVAEAIRSNPALLAQAEKAFTRARIEVIG
jgi:hypothetical protein